MTGPKDFLTSDMKTLWNYYGSDLKLLRITPGTNQVRAVLDTTSLQEILITNRDQSLRTIESRMRRNRLELVLDKEGGLSDEWCATCSRKVVSILITKWEELRGLVHIDEVPKLAPQITKKLVQLGFRNKFIDKLVIRLALTQTERNIVADDPDFWHPARPKLRGDPSAPIASYLNNDFSIVVRTASQFLDDE